MPFWGTDSVGLKEACPRWGSRFLKMMGGCLDHSKALGVLMPDACMQNWLNELRCHLAGPSNYVLDGVAILPWNGAVLGVVQIRPCVRM